MISFDYNSNTIFKLDLSTSIKKSKNNPFTSKTYSLNVTPLIEGNTNAAKSTTNKKLDIKINYVEKTYIDESNSSTVVL